MRGLIRTVLDLPRMESSDWQMIIDGEGKEAIVEQHYGSPGPARSPVVKEGSAGVASKSVIVVAKRFIGPELDAVVERIPISTHQLLCTDKHSEAKIGLKSSFPEKAEQKRL